MRHLQAGDEPKGWLGGPWSWDLPVSLGYANRGFDDPHEHTTITEIYLVARGTAELRVEREPLTLLPGDVLVVEPGEAHTFVSSSPDYLHFVVHVPGLAGEEATAEKSTVGRERLGLFD